MGDFDPSFIHTLCVQSWTMYGIGMFLVMLRMYARIHRVGLKGLQPDDYLMMVAGALYTTLITCLNVISSGGGSNLYEPDQFSEFTPHEIQERITGSKIVIVSEQAMLNVIYTIKACLLIMYSRLTLGLQVQRMVMYLMCYVAVGWVSTQIAFFTACRPFKGYWAMPPPNPQCTTLEHYAIVQACFNISSDALMLFIPLPLITKLNVPYKQKAVLMMIFSMGVFVILAAILTKVFNLSNVYDPTYMLWYTREASVAIYVSNLPLIWPLLREWFPVLRNMTTGGKSTGTNDRRTAHLGYEKHPSSNRDSYNKSKSRAHTFSSKRPSDYEYDASKTGGLVTTIRGKDVESFGSREELSSREEEMEMGVMPMGKWQISHPPHSGGKDLEAGNGIKIQTTVHVTESYSRDGEGHDELPIQGPKRMRSRSKPRTEGSGRDLEMGVMPSESQGFEWEFQKHGERR